jgi:hypothetical protein
MGRGACARGRRSNTDEHHDHILHRDRLGLLSNFCMLASGIVPLITSLAQLI